MLLIMKDLNPSYIWGKADFLEDFFSKMVTATYDETLCKFLFCISEEVL